tara:strand:+ start:1821 stop:1997 length:177 start_codon:yes stop_codon:yes gene_type:complete
LRSSYFGGHCSVLVVFSGSFGLVLFCARGGLLQEEEEEEEEYVMMFEDNKKKISDFFI